MSVADRLPAFTKHEADLKNFAMRQPKAPPEYIRRFLDGYVRDRQGSETSVRLLDVGCGRGDTVAWLLERGWDAYGLDVSEDYVRRGQEYLHKRGFDPDRLRLIREDGTYPFEDGAFEVILSDQVIEHVPDLERFAREVARVSAPEAVGLHIFPAKWRPIETHMKTPLAHWLPKGPARRTAIRWALRVRAGAPYFQELTLCERTMVFSQFSEDETFYRNLRRTVATFHRHGLVCDPKASSQDKLHFHLPWLPQASLVPLGFLYRHIFSVVLHMRRV